MLENNENVFDKIIRKLRKLDGRQLGKSFRTGKTKLGKNEREAWVNRMIEQYRNEEYVDGKPVDLPPEKYDITVEEQIKEMVKDEIIQVLKE